MPSSGCAGRSPLLSPNRQLPENPMATPLTDKEKLEVLRDMLWRQANPDAQSAPVTDEEKFRHLRQVLREFPPEGQSDDIAT